MYGYVTTDTGRLKVVPGENLFQVTASNFTVALCDRLIVLEQNRQRSLLGVCKHVRVD